MPVAFAQVCAGVHVSTLFTMFHQTLTSVLYVGY